MNILVPYTWLKDHLHTTASPADLQRLLSLSGPTVEGVEKIHGDSIFNIEITTNRMDSASIRGIAREASVILPQAKMSAKLINVSSYVPKKNELSHDSTHFPITITNDSTLCPRVTCVILSVKTGKTPLWMKTRLEQVGIRSLNNIIDVTNYVMTEIGQPTHVFDADRLGNTMIIRESKKGETLITLDDKKHTLLGGDIVVDNGNGELVDLIGIMGTANSVVTDQTKRILFFIEHANPIRIRKTSMGLAIRTNAAQLNEKMIDPNLVMDAMLRGIALFQDVADAKVESPILDLYPRPISPRTIILSEKKTETYLGVSLPIPTQIEILEALGCDVNKKNNVLEVTVPTLRPDLEIPVDLVEEIARIYGYHNLPSTLMDTRLPTSYPEDTNFALEYDVKQFLAAIGWQEVYTYSAVSADVAQQTGISVEKHLSLANPLNDEHVYMRQSLVPSHIEVIEKNRHLPSVSIFELANVYIPREKDLPDESLRLTLTSNESFRVVKGAVEALLAHLFIPADTITFNQNGEHHTEILVGKKIIGSLVFEPGRSITIAGFMWKELLKVVRKHPTYQQISQYSPILEDLTFTLPKGVKVGEVLITVKALHSSIKRVTMKDIFKQNLTIRVQYLSKDKQITGDDVIPIRKKIVDAIQKKWGGIIVGNI